MYFTYCLVHTFKVNNSVASRESQLSIHHQNQLYDIFVTPEETLHPLAITSCSPSSWKPLIYFLLLDFSILDSLYK